MTNREIDREMGKQISIERTAGRQILRLIVLAEKQRLSTELGYKDLADWLVRGHRVSERSAYRKLKAAKLSFEVPEVLEKIETGALSMATVVQVQYAIQAREKTSGKKMTADAKAEIIKKVEGLKAIETERTLVSLFPEIGCEAKKDHTQVVSESISRLSINLQNDTVDMIQRARDLLSHSMHAATQAEVIAYVFQDFLERKDPLRKKECSRKSTPAVPTQSTGKCRREAAKSDADIPAAIRREVIQKANGECEFIDFESRTVCGSRYQLQVDHIQPRALGGTNDLSNLRCLCRKHNLFMSKKNLGRKAEEWRTH